jgi:hypothetical protein
LRISWLGLDYRDVRVFKRLQRLFPRYVFCSFSCCCSAPASFLVSSPGPLDLLIRHESLLEFNPVPPTTANAQVAFKTFLNISPTLSFPPPPSTTPNAPLQEFILSFDENPLSEFAELPQDAREGGLWFSNVLCGVVRGALEMVSSNTHIEEVIWANDRSLYRLKRGFYRMC